MADEIKGLFTEDSIPSGGIEQTPQALDQAEYDAIRSIELYNIAPTGLITGGEVTINGGDNTKFDVAAGSGRVVNSYTDPTNPSPTEVAWTAFSAQTVSLLATNPWSYLGIDSAGTLVQQATPFTPAQRRDIIVLAKLVHTNKTNLEVVVPFLFVAFDSMLDAYDFLQVIGPVNVTGNVITANGANLKLDKSVGQIFRQGANYRNNKKRPSITDEPLQAPATLGYDYRDGTNGWVQVAGAADVVPGKWDNNSGVLQTVTAGKWTIQPIFVFGESGRVWLQYGQVEYMSKDDALSSVSDSIEISPHFPEAVLRGWLVVIESATDLSNTAEAEIVIAGKLGLTDIVSGAGGGEANTASNVGASGVGVFKQKSGVDLEFKKLVAASSKISITDTTSEIDIDVAEGNILHQNLSGLNNDDHLQYHDNTRGDARYYTQAQIDSTVSTEILTAGAVCLTGNTGTEFLNVQDVWAFRYKDGAGLNDTGIFLDTTANTIEFRLLDTPKFAVDLVSNQAHLYGTLQLDGVPTFGDGSVNNYVFTVNTITNNGTITYVSLLQEWQFNNTIKADVLKLGDTTANEAQLSNIVDNVRDSTALRDIYIEEGLPADNQILVYDSTTNSYLFEDQFSDSPTADATAIQGIYVNAGAPTDNEVLIYDSTSNSYIAEPFLSDALPLSDMTAALAGTNLLASRDDHVHPLTAANQSRVIMSFVASGSLSAGKIDVARIISHTCTIEKIKVFRADSGAGGSTIIDINKAASGGTPTSLYTDGTNLPTINATDGNNFVLDATLPDVINLLEDWFITVDIDQTESGAPKNLVVEIFCTIDDQ